MKVIKRKERDPNQTCWDIYIVRGDSGYITLSITDNDNQPIVLTENDIVRCQVRKQPDGGELLFNGTIEITEQGILWHILPSDTQTVESGNYVWDAELYIDSTRDVFTFIPESKFIILPSVTEPEV